MSLFSCLYMFRAHVLIVRRPKLYYTVYGIITHIGGHPVRGTVSITYLYKFTDHCHRLQIQLQ
jgi:hypothetical protein